MNERNTVVLHGRMVEFLYPLLDGQYTRNEIIERAWPVFRPDEVGRQIDRLCSAGYVVETPHCEDGQATAYWELAGLDSAQAIHELTERNVSVTTVGGADTAPLLDALNDAGLRIAPKTADLAIVVVDHLLDPGLLAFNEERIAEGRPWFVAKLAGPTAYLGPVMEPGRTACWQCAAHWLQGMHLESKYIQDATGKTVMAEEPVAPAMVTGVTARLAALHAAKWIAGARDDDRYILTFHTTSFRAERHPLLRRPQCVACGDPEFMKTQSLRPISFTQDQEETTRTRADRLLSAEAVLDRFGNLVSHVTGIISDLRLQEAGSDLLKVCDATLNFAVTKPDIPRGRVPLRTRSSGQGHTAAEAKASALCEAIERYSAVWQGDEYLIRAKYAEVADAAVHPNALQLYSECQYRERAKWKANESSSHWVADPFDEQAECDWTPVWSLSNHRRVYVPSAALYYGCNNIQGREFIKADSNGCAAGGSLAEAVLHGLLEVIERDSVALWWYNRVRRPSVEIGALESSSCARWLEAQRAIDREAWILDVTSDLGIPTAVAISRRTDDPQEVIILGCGAGLSMSAAVAKAVHEHSQLLPLGMRFGSQTCDLSNTALMDWLRTASVEDNPYLLPLTTEYEGNFRVESEAREGESTVEIIQKLQRRLEEGGMELLVADQSRPEIGLPVAKVIVPGMRHIWPRYAPGRLYEVPVRMGWRDFPTAEEELNPIGLFL
ncbi:TOMM precursor leader peptide-binding protein [Streptomyces chartreusis]|uniref:TOMM precursor leader peptide-binding protein n=1 Tax=Streptomyces chartreusis TaxID=1969 RepID=UPI0036CF1E5B